MLALATPGFHVLITLRTAVVKTFYIPLCMIYFRDLATHKTTGKSSVGTALQVLVFIPYVEFYQPISRLL